MKWNMMVIIVCRLIGKGLTNCNDVLVKKCSYIAILVLRYSIVNEQSNWYSDLVINIKLEFEMSVMIKIWQREGDDLV